MLSKTTTAYEFGEFVLIPSRDLILHLGKPIPFLGKELAILTFLVENANQDVTEPALIQAVWGSDVKIARGNVSHHIAKIRRSLGCDAHRPKYIRTLRSKRAYRFIAKVDLRELGGTSIETLTTDSHVAGNGKYSISANLFVPVFVGREAYKRIRNDAERRRWGEYKVFKIETGSLFINPSGFGVWHLALPNTFSTLREMAAWRKTVYNEILNGKHVINVCTKEIIKPDNYASLFHQMRWSNLAGHESPGRIRG